MRPWGHLWLEQTQMSTAKTKVLATPSLRIGSSNILTQELQKRSLNTAYLYFVKSFLKSPYSPLCISLIFVFSVTSTPQQTL